MSTKNIVLIHGLWVTSRSWENWVSHFTAKGYTVHTPTYPGLEVEVEALNADPSPIAALTIEGIIEHLEGFIKGLDEAPIIMGHSFGGLLTQIMLDKGLGKAGVAIDSVPPEGVRVSPPEQLRSVWPVLNPLTIHKAVPFSEDQFHYAFANALSAEESAKVYKRYHIPAPGGFVWTGILANILPGHQISYVNFQNESRAPLLIIAGGKDHLMPEAVNHSNFKHYSGPAVTEFKAFPERSHFTCGEPGWEAVADYALEWAESHQKS